MAKQRSAFVLGGTSGIGHSIAASLSMGGFDVSVSGRRAPKNSPQMRWIGCDLQNLDDYETLLQNVVSCDVFVNAFGPFNQDGIGAYSINEVHRQFVTNAAGPIYLASHFLQNMRQTKYGRLVFFGNSDVELGRAYTKTALYSAAKASLFEYVKSVAKMNWEGVYATLVSPGVVDSGTQSHSDLEKWLRVLKKQRIVQPRQIAVVLEDFWYKDGANFNGKVVTID